MELFKLKLLVFVDGTFADNKDFAPKIGISLFWATRRQDSIWHGLDGNKRWSSWVTWVLEDEILGSG